MILGVQNFNLYNLLMPCGLPFSTKFRDRLNLLNCNKYNAKTILLRLNASHFGIKNGSTKHVFLNPFLGHHFSHFM